MPHTSHTSHITHALPPLPPTHICIIHHAHFTQMFTHICTHTTAYQSHTHSGKYNHLGYSYLKNKFVADTTISALLLNHPTPGGCIKLMPKMELGIRDTEAFSWLNKLSWPYVILCLVGQNWPAAVCTAQCESKRYGELTLPEAQ